MLIRGLRGAVDTAVGVAVLCVTLWSLDSIRTRKPAAQHPRRGRGKACACGRVQVCKGVVTGAEALGLWDDGENTHSFCRTCGAHVILPEGAGEGAGAKSGSDDGACTKGGATACSAPPDSAAGTGTAAAASAIAPEEPSAAFGAAELLLPQLATDLAAALQQREGAAAAAAGAPPAGRQPPPVKLARSGISADGPRRRIAPPSGGRAPGAPAADAADAPPFRQAALDVAASLTRLKRHLHKHIES